MAFFKPIFRPAGLIIISAICLAVGNSVEAQAPARLTNFPLIHLPRHVSGEEAIAALGDKLPDVAAFYRKTPEGLRDLLRRDKSLRLDQQGRLYYVCPLDGTVAFPEPEANSAPGPSALAPLDQTFLLHSRRGATKTIFLDFDGFTLTGTAWNDHYNGGADIVAPPWDTDGDPTTFGTSERTAIQQMWQRVSEDYAPFDVDVTTEYPGEAALTRSSSSDQVYGVRALVSAIGSYFGGGGISYVGVFDSVGDYNKPSLIFPENLGNSEKNIAEAISHEVGHSLGLSHDGTTTGSTYYSGQGNWAPIMGVGYYKPITTWSKGEYTNANNFEDDLTIMTQNGVAYRADDYGSTIATATALAGSSLSVTGLIERASDKDFFSFQSGAGSMQVLVTPSERGPNLHLFISLYDGSGALLTNREVADTSAGVQPVGLSRAVAAGNYYISVEGTGSGNPVTTGYSDYASIGQYTMSLTLPALPPGVSAWTATAGGSFAWTNAANWSVGVPNGTGGTARLTNNITGNETITLNVPVTLGSLELGDANSSQAFTLQSGPGGSLGFSAATGSAYLVKSAGFGDMISASIALQSPLIVSNSSGALLALNGPVTGAGTNGLTKAGSGAVTLAGTNTYSGQTTVNAGTLLINGRVGTNAVRVNAGGVLGGNGVVTGPVTVQSGGVLSPGTSIGTLTISNTLTLSGTTLMELNRSGPTNDVLTVSGSMTRGGVLVVTNIGAALASGDSFTLFKAASSSGAFSSVTLPTLGASLRWNTNQFASAGMLSVFAVQSPSVQPAGISGTNLTLRFVSQSGVTYVLQTATNLNRPVAWQNVSTNAGTGGMLNLLGPITKSTRQRFWRLLVY